jgi:hypothetical protein
VALTLPARRQGKLSQQIMGMKNKVEIDTEINSA